MVQNLYFIFPDLWQDGACAWLAMIWSLVQSCSEQPFLTLNLETILCYSKMLCYCNIQTIIIEKFLIKILRKSMYYNSNNTYFNKLKHSEKEIIRNWCFDIFKDNWPITLNYVFFICIFTCAFPFLALARNCNPIGHSSTFLNLT